MSLARFRAQCLEWERIYGKPERGSFSWNPADINTACVKCGKSKVKMNRHHIASDFVFALFRPDLYAKRYIEFRKEDVAKLCKNCHIKVERYYEPIKRKMWQEYNQKTCTEEWCEKWKAEFRKAWEKFLKTKPRGKKRSK